MNPTLTLTLVSGSRTVIDMASWHSSSKTAYPDNCQASSAVLAVSCSCSFADSASFAAFLRFTSFQRSVSSDISAGRRVPASQAGHCSPRRSLPPNLAA